MPQATVVGPPEPAVDHEGRCRGAAGQQQRTTMMTYRLGAPSAAKAQRLTRPRTPAGTPASRHQVGHDLGVHPPGGRRCDGLALERRWPRSGSGELPLQLEGADPMARSEPLSSRASTSRSYPCAGNVSSASQKARTAPWPADAEVPGAPTPGVGWRPAPTLPMGRGEGGVRSAREPSTEPSSTRRICEVGRVGKEALDTGLGRDRQSRRRNDHDSRAGRAAWAAGTLAAEHSGLGPAPTRPSLLISSSTRPLRERLRNPRASWLGDGAGASASARSSHRSCSGA